MATIRNSVFSLLLSLFVAVASAQTQADSIAFQNADWKILLDSTGVVCKRSSFRIFDSDQQISVLEISPEYFKVGVAQLHDRMEVRDIALANNALMAVNGGFFQTDTDRAVANDFIKTNNTVLPVTGGWGSAAMGIDTNGRIHFSLWRSENAENNNLWQEGFEDVMVAGPMLTTGYSGLFTAHEGDVAPRTIIGNKSDGTIVMAVIDGRRNKRDGMAFWQCSVIAGMLGMENCLNLDGGGSSSMWIKGRGYVNSPSDGFLFIRWPRKVANAIIVSPK